MLLNIFWKKTTIKNVLHFLENSRNMFFWFALWTLLHVLSDLKVNKNINQCGRLKKKEKNNFLDLWRGKKTNCMNTEVVLKATYTKSSVHKVKVLKNWLYAIIVGGCLFLWRKKSILSSYDETNLTASLCTKNTDFGQIIYNARWFFTFLSLISLVQSYGIIQNIGFFNTDD